MEEIPPVPINFIGLARELMSLVRSQDVAGGINSSSVLFVLNEEANFFESDDGQRLTSLFCVLRRLNDSSIWLLFHSTKPKIPHLAPVK